MPKLAPITIPAFDGGWQQWSTFIGIFISLIHDNPCLTPIQKMQYLHNYLQGEARDSTRHIPLSNDYYSLSILKRRYDNPRRLCKEFAANLRPA